MNILYALLRFPVFIKKFFCFIGLHSWRPETSYIHWKCEVCGKEKVGF